MFDNVVYDHIKAKNSLQHLDIEIRENDLGVRVLKQKIKNLELEN